MPTRETDDFSGDVHTSLFGGLVVKRADPPESCSRACPNKVRFSPSFATVTSWGSLSISIQAPGRNSGRGRHEKRQE